VLTAAQWVQFEHSRPQSLEHSDQGFLEHYDQHFLVQTDSLGQSSLAEHLERLLH